MKKLFALLLAVGLTASLTGCGLVSRGTVVLWNHDPDADAAWQEIAQLYEEQKNVKVKVVSVDPQDYEEALASELEEGGGPGIFCCSSAWDAARYQAYMLDLKGTDLAAQCVNWDYTLSTGDEILAVGYTKEYTGILVNKALLKAAGYSREEITDFASLKAVAEDITARSEQLRFHAFTGSSGDTALQMVNNALYYGSGDAAIQPSELEDTQLENLKNILQLYILNGSVSGTELAFLDQAEAAEAFSRGEAAFCIGSSVMYRRLVEAGMRPEDLAMIPLYCGAEAEQSKGLSAGTKHYWAVNSQASEKEIQLGLEFLNWMASSQEGLSMLQEQYGDVPFRNAGKPENVFCLDAKALEWEGRSSFPWVYDRIDAEEDWLEEIVFAMKVYYSVPAETNWSAIIQVFEEQ